MENVCGKKGKSFTYQDSKFIECCQAAIQRLAPDETELGLAPPVQSDDTVFLNPRLSAVMADADSQK